MSAQSPTQTHMDLREDFQELRYVAIDARKRLTAFLDSIKKNKHNIAPETYHACRSKTNEAIAALTELSIQLARNETDMTLARKTKYHAIEYLRTHMSQYAALMTTTDWQSPSFAHSMHSEAGRETGRIYETKNDYKRDQHWQAFDYEQAFRAAYYPGFASLFLHVDAFVSGMAAFTTIVGFLVGEHLATGHILMGKRTYFENKELIQKFFAGRVTEIDEGDTKMILETVDRLKPSVIFLDSFTNATEIVCPHLAHIIPALLKILSKDTFLVIDNTGLAAMYNPFQHVQLKKTKLRIISFESLNKYHQFGNDRVTGGIVVSHGKNTEKLFDYRVHMGTNIPDVLAASLPTPNKKMLRIRMQRLERNAATIAQAMQTWIETHKTNSLEKIVYPDTISYRGSYLIVKFQSHKENVPTYQRFVRTALSNARKRGVQLTGGSSFGLHATRVYITAIRSKPVTPFVRIAAGSEDADTVEKLITVFKETLAQFT